MPSYLESEAEEEEEEGKEEVLLRHAPFKESPQPSSKQLAEPLKVLRNSRSTEKSESVSSLFFPGNDTG